MNTARLKHFNGTYSFTVQTWKIRSYFKQSPGKINKINDGCI